MANNLSKLIHYSFLWELFPYPPSIMDRNLGAPDVNYHGNNNGAVFYQFGRKDPFAGGSLYKPDGSSISISTIAWNSGQITQETNKKGKNVPYSIQNPLKFITNSGPWTTGDQYCPVDGGNFVWQDPKSLSSTDGKVKKSIFDPCPTGWMVPMNGTWNGLVSKNPAWSTTNSNGLGIYYYPAGTGKTGIYAFYPAGCRSSGNSYTGENGSYSWTCSNTSLNVSLFYVSDYNGGYIYFDKFDVRASGYHVRCIQEYF